MINELTMSHSGESILKIDEIIDIYKDTIDFLKLISGERAFEIRLIEEGSNSKNPVSLSYLVCGDHVYDYKLRYTNSLSRRNGNIFEDLIFRDHLTRHGVLGFNDFGFFFIPNSPNFEELDHGTLNDKDIKYINCQFVDIDAPSEVREDITILEKWKKQQIGKVNQWVYPPSIIVKSKNGIHCYWLINDGSKEQFRYIQLQLAYYFGGDIKCQNSSRALRLPCFMHKKDRKNPYYVYAWRMQDIRFTQEQLSEALPKPSEEIIKESVKKQREKVPAIQLDPGQEKRLWKLVKSHLDVSRDTKDKIICRCPMPDHEDSNPSAWFDKEYQWFHCGSTHCGVSIPLEELAEELDWEDVSQELSRTKYQIDIINDYKGLREHMVKVSDSPELELSKFENENVDKIAEKVFSIFQSRNQMLNEKHKLYIRDIINILYKGEKCVIPDLISLDIGGGKSTIIETFIIEMLKINSNYGAILVKERIEDAVSAAQNINDSFGENVAYPMYGFQEKECKRNLGKCDSKYRTSKNGKPYRYSNCEYKKDCRYYNQYKEQQKCPILVITHERLFDEVKNDTFADKYKLFNKVFIRQQLICDEKPKMIYNSGLTEWQFNKYSQSILTSLINMNDEAYKEFKNAIDLISPIYNSEEREDRKARESLQPINPNFSFTKNFWVEFGSMTHYKDEYHKLPEVIENIIRYGGHRTVKKVKEGQIVTVYTSHYCFYTYGNQFHTIIFDGTADIDFSYMHDKYRIFNFEPLREYTNFVFYECSYLKSTKKEMEHLNILDAFIEQVKQIAEEYPQSKIYLPVYLRDEKYIKEGLKEYIITDKIKVAHYGATKGSNDYQDCDIVIIQGILNKTDDYYIDIYRALTKKYIDDLDTTYFGGLRRFNCDEIEQFKITDQNVEYTQEIKRSMQRDQTRDVPGKVYLFTYDTSLLEVLKWKFPGCQTIKWNPAKILEEKIVNNKHKQAKNDKLIYEFFKQNCADDRIAFQDIASSMNLDKSTVSQVLGKPAIKGVIENLGFIRIREGKNVFYIKSTSSNSLS